jgi:hypothetical protein
MRLVATTAEAFEALRAREPVFHRAQFGTTVDAFEAMVAPDFWEVGASGSVYSRATVLAVYAKRYADPAYEPMAGLAVDDFAVAPLGNGVWLATYRLAQGERLTRRASIWRGTADGWQVAYHQGTVIGGETA